MNLPWDGTYLNNVQIKEKFKFETQKYACLQIEDHLIYCILEKYDTFPLIIEELRTIFNISRRKFHLIETNNNNKQFIIYYVPFINDKIVWETPLHKLPKNHVLRHNPTFKQEVRKVILFCELLSLSNTRQANLMIRSKSEVINTNDKKTIADPTCLTMCKEKMLNDWFSSSSEFKQTLDLMIIDLNLLKKQIEEIILRIDKSYIWFSCLVIQKIHSMNKFN